MGRLPPLLVATIVIISMMGMSTIVLAQSGTDSAPDNESEVAPGERLGGAIGVQNAEIDGDLQDRRFGHQVAAAQTDDEAAGIVATQLDDIDTSLDALAEEADDLEAAYEAGDISEGQYNARMATLATERATIDRLVNSSHAVAEGLPADVLSANNISVERIQELRDRAAELPGPEVAEIAREIAGPDIGERLSPAAEDRDNDERGPPDDRGPADGDDDDTSAE